MKKKNASPGRVVVVFSTLLGILSLTSVILLLLAPAPLAPGPAESLFAIDSPDTMASIFETRKPLNHWKYIYVHHSEGEKPGEIEGDHFMIGNGTGLADGELQIGQRWEEQGAAAPPRGAEELSANCICVCISGNFDQTVPTPTQLRRLAELVSTLQNKLDISTDHIVFVDHAQAAAGIGRYFPVAAFRQQLGL